MAKSSQSIIWGPGVLFYGKSKAHRNPPKTARLLSSFEFLLPGVVLSTLGAHLGSFIAAVFAPEKGP